MFVQASVFVTDNRKDVSYYKMFPDSVSYEYVMFYSTGLRSYEQILLLAVNASQ